MSDLIKTPKGYIRVGEIARFYVRDSPGWHDHQRVIVVMKSANGGSPPEHFNTEMFEEEFMAAYNKAWEKAKHS